MYEEMNFESIIDKMLKQVTEVFPDIDTREGSVIYNALAPATVEIQDLYIALDTVLNESFADTQSREFLKNRCAERGIIPDEATCAIRKGEFTGEYNIADIIGTEFSLGQLNYECEKCEKSYFKLECETPGGGNDDSGTLNPIREVLGLESARLISRDISEQNSQEDEPETNEIILAEFSGTFNNEDLSVGFTTEKYKYKVIGKLSAEELEENGFKDKQDIFRMKCTTFGKVGNFDEGDLIPVAYIEGLDTAKLTGIIAQGRDEEETEHLRQKYFDNVNAFAFGGNIADYKAKVLSLSGSETGDKDVIAAGGVGYVKVKPAWKGGGTVKIIILDSDFNAPLTDNPDDEDYLSGHPLVCAVQKAIFPKKKNEIDFSKVDGMGIAPIGHDVTVVSAQEQKIKITVPITYIDDNKDNRNTVYKALLDYFSSIIKKWRNNEDLEITAGQVYMCIQAVPCVKSVEISKIYLDDGKDRVTISIENIPVLGGFDDGPSDEIN